MVLALCLVPPLAWLGVGAWAFLALSADPSFEDAGSRGELSPGGVALLSLVVAQSAALMVGLPATVLAFLFAWLPDAQARQPARLRRV